MARQTRALSGTQAAAADVKALGKGDSCGDAALPVVANDEQGYGDRAHGARV
jgi:hypothetical protein